MGKYDERRIKKDRKSGFYGHVKEREEKNMYKWVYDRMVEEYEKEEKIDLINKIMTYSEIEVSDRTFANQCCAGADVYNINTFFEFLEEKGYTKDEKFKEIFEKAMNSWQYIRRGLLEMKFDTRVSEAEKDFEERVNSAKDKMDII